jgi:hypothetical protein
MTTDVLPYGILLRGASLGAIEGLNLIKSNLPTEPARLGSPRTLLTTKTRLNAKIAHPQNEDKAIHQPI